MCKINLKDTYFTIHLENTSCHLVNFLWEGNLCKFPCLCLGLRPVPQFLTSRDFQQLETLIFLFQHFGFVMNLTKFRHGTSTNNRINRSCDKFDGMTVSLTEKRKNFLLKQIKITAEYVPGILSTRAKWQCSHSKIFSKLKLSPIVLESIHKEIEMPITPMFASRLLNQIEKYILQIPDPHSLATDE